MDRLNRKPDPENKVGLRGKEASSRNPGVNAKNDQAQMRVKSSPTNSNEQSTKPVGESRRPITNADESRNIVNGQDDAAIGEKENEGD